MRGDVKSLFPMTLEGMITLENIGSVNITITVVPSDPQEFTYWYQDVFDAYFDEGDLDPETSETLEGLYEIHFDATRANYGA